MNTEFDPVRAAAWRGELIEYVSVRRRRPRLFSLALVALGVIGGAGVSTGAFAAAGGWGSWMYPATPSGGATPTYGDAIDAPDGVLPGAPVIVVLGDATTVEVTASTEMSLDGAPDGATHARVTVTARAPGSVSWGTDPDGNNPSIVATQEDVDGGRATSSYDVPLDDTEETLFVVPSGGADALVTLQYVTHIPTRLGVNADGDTYGVDGGPSGAPDLVAVVGADAAGDPVDGYVRRADLYADSPDATSAPTTPEEALRRQEERESANPGGWRVPLYASDGRTQIGTFRIG